MKKQELLQHNVGGLIADSDGVRPLEQADKGVVASAAAVVGPGHSQRPTACLLNEWHMDGGGCCERLLWANFCRRRCSKSSESGRHRKARPEWSSSSATLVVDALAQQNLSAGAAAGNRQVRVNPAIANACGGQRARRAQQTEHALQRESCS